MRRWVSFQKNMLLIILTTLIIFIVLLYKWHYQRERELIIERGEYLFEKIKKFEQIHGIKPQSLREILPEYKDEDAVKYESFCPYKTKEDLPGKGLCYYFEYGIMVGDIGNAIIIDLNKNYFQYKVDNDMGLN